MKTISIKELHQHTGAYVRRARKEPVIVTERGVPAIKLNPLLAGASKQKYWASRLKYLSVLPKMESDSAQFISEDRDGR